MASISVTISNNLDLSPEDFYSLCEDIFNEIVDNTPVDTGYCQSKWEFSMVSDNECEIANPCDYVSYLEDGHSSQAPDGMVQKALDKFL
jgi:hypothetical protein